MKGPARWPQAGSRSPVEQGTNLSCVLRKLAHVTEPSLASISDSWHRRQTGGMSAVSQSVAPTRMLPACAMTIGVIYDANEIHIVAHIAYTAHGARRYLSLLFDTLPFPRSWAGQVPSDFVRARYRVALALLSLQQHVLRMVTLAEPLSSALNIDLGPAQKAAWQTRLECLGWKRGSPTPSSPCSSEYDDDDARNSDDESGDESGDEEESPMGCKDSRSIGYVYHRFPVACCDKAKFQAVCD